MSGYALTPLAKADIFEIWAYIAEDSEAGTDRIEQAIFDACAFVAEAPLQIVAVMHGKRNNRRILKQRQ